MPQILMGGTAVWQRRDVVIGGNLSTEFKLPKSGGRGGKSDTLCSMNAQLNNKGNGQVGRGLAGAGCLPAGWLPACLPACPIAGAVMWSAVEHSCSFEQCRDYHAAHLTALLPYLGCLLPLCCSWCCA
jgi:hypothetical protein